MTETAITRPRPIRWLAELRDIAGLAFLVLAFQSFVAKPFYIPSESMMPTLQVGDRLIVSRWPYGWSFTAAPFHLLPVMHGRLFGRLPERAFPGFATAHVAASDGRPYCRLHIVQETLPNGASYATIDFGPSPADDMPATTVPPGHVFLMGDNRDMSADSRVPTEFNGLGGAVPIENIGGRAELVTFSLNGSATWNPLTWFTMFRSDRVGRTLRQS